MQINVVRLSKKNVLCVLFALCFAIMFIMHGSTAYASPDKSKFVTDKAEMLSSEDESTIENALYEIYEQTGIEYAVYISQSLDGGSIEEVSLNKFRSLGLGDAKKNNGLLLYIAKEDRQFRLEVGYGLEGVIPDTQAKKIIDCMTSYFQSEDYCKGILASITKTVEILNDSGEYTIAQGEEYAVSSSDEKDVILTFIVLFVIIIIFASIIASRNDGPFGGSSSYGGSFGGSFGSSGGGFGGGSCGGGGSSGGW